MSFFFRITKMLSFVFYLVVLFASNRANLFNAETDTTNSTNWDYLSVTFGHHHSIPMNVEDALKHGWILLSDGCKPSDEGVFKGQIYAKGDRMDTFIIFDVNGLVAGVQMGIPKETQVAKKWIGKAIYQVGNVYYITVYFTDPSIICKQDNKRDRHVLGDKLVIFNGENELMEVPLHEKDLLGTKWINGRCFWGMGQHYWYGISKDMDCNDFFPVFIMYNHHLLDAFGFATNGALSGNHLEHPSKYMLSLFFKKDTLPKCLSDFENLSSQHVFLNNNWRFC